MSFLSELAFTSALVYSKRGSSAEAEKSRELRDRLKRGDPVLIERAAQRLATWFEAPVLDQFFGADVILVPVPGSAAMAKKAPRARAVTGGLWIARELCRAIRSAGHGAEVWPGLRRTQTVPKSAFAAPGQRPTLQRHYETMVCEARLFAGRVTLVDDIVTRGRTLLAAASRVREVLPQAEVRAFALVRTMNLVLDIEQIVQPCVGRIRCVDADAEREP